MTTQLTIPPTSTPSLDHACDYDDHMDDDHGATVLSPLDSGVGGTPAYLCKDCVRGYLLLALHNIECLIDEADDSGPVDADTLATVPAYVQEIAWYTQILALWPKTAPQPRVDSPSTHDHLNCRMGN
jgi:hypothetical protein